MRDDGFSPASSAPPDEQLARALTDDRIAGDEIALGQWTGSVDGAAQQALWEQAWAVRTDPAPAGDVTAFIARWRETIDRDTRAAMPASRSTPSRMRSKRTTWIASTVACAALLGIALVVPRVWTPTGEHNTQTTQQSAENGRVYTTVAAQRARVTLPDGSQVSLAPGSRLRVSDTFAKNTRDVWLDGEAVFTVMHETNAPFTVHAAGVATRVLGTTFSVRKYAADSVIRVAVAEGRVALDAVTVVGAGDVAVAVPGMRAQVRRVGDVSRYFGWTDGRLAFQNTPVPQVLAELSRWYDLDLSVADARLRADSLTTSLDNASEADMLDMLAASLNARVVREGRRVTLYAR